MDLKKHDDQPKPEAAKRRQAFSTDDFLMLWVIPAVMGIFVFLTFAGLVSDTAPGSGAAGGQSHQDLEDAFTVIRDMTWNFIAIGALVISFKIRRRWKKMMLAAEAEGRAGS